MWVIDINRSASTKWILQMAGLNITWTMVLYVDTYCVYAYDICQTNHSSHEGNMWRNAITADLTMIIVIIMMMMMMMMIMMMTLMLTTTTTTMMILLYVKTKKNNIYQRFWRPWDPLAWYVFQKQCLCVLCFDIAWWGKCEVMILVINMLMFYVSTECQW